MVEMAYILGRSYQSVVGRRQRAKRGIQPRRSWQPHEDIIAMRDDLTRAEIAALLGRTVGAVKVRQRLLRGYSRRNHYRVK